MAANVTPTENRKTVISFARRLADYVSLGNREYDALPLIAAQFIANGTEADRQVAQAAQAVADAMQQGRTRTAWEPHVDVFGEHLVGLVSSVYGSDSYGELSAALYAAAATLESDLRTGYAL